MIVYHGSKRIIEKPIPTGSDPFNDYGPSFYLTTDLSSAKAWACKNDELGHVNKYRIRNEVYARLSVLDLTDKTKHDVLQWIAILLHFRKLDASFLRRNKEAIEWLNVHYIDVTAYDVVIGYRADDSYFRFPKEFINGNLALEDLESAYMLGKLGIQYAFMSPKAIASLAYVGSIDCEPSFLGGYHATVKAATLKFDELLSLPKMSTKTYILDLVR